jgi:predicted nuclease with TOPRIM domain
MSEDLTKKLPKTDSEKIALILTIVQKIEIDYDNLAGRLNNLEHKVEERLYDTRPIWQKVVADIAQLQEGQTRLQEGQTRLQEGQTRLEGEVHEIKVSMREIFFKLDVLNDTMLTVQARNKDLDIRVRELEQRPQKPTNSQT